MDVGCTSLQGFGASTNITARSDLTTSVRLSNNPIFLKFHPHLQSPEVYQCEDAPICPSTAYQGAKALCIYMIWMWDVIYGALEAQP